MDNGEKISIKKAICHLKKIYNISVTTPTMIRWCKIYDLGIQLGVGGRWIVDSCSLETFIREGTYKRDKGAPNGQG